MMDTPEQEWLPGRLTGLQRPVYVRQSIQTDSFLLAGRVDEIVQHNWE